MKIKRVVNGVEMEFELTDIEIGQAYVQRELEYTIDDVEQYLDGEENPLADKDVIEQIAQYAIHTLGDNDSYYDAYWETIRYAVKEVMEGRG